MFAERGEIISAGNFHGEYPAKALDYLAIGVHELAAMSERRIERLVNPAYSELPAFLVKDGGLNSGFMLAHCTAAALGKNNICFRSSQVASPKALWAIFKFSKKNQNKPVDNSLKQKV